MLQIVMQKWNLAFVINGFVGPGGGVGLGCLVTGIVGSNTARGMDVCLCVSVLCYPV
jgi:hypothetical protein